MLLQPDQGREQRPMRLQPADDGLKIGPEVMPVSSVTLGDRHVGRTHVGPFCVGRVLR